MFGDHLEESAKPFTVAGQRRDFTELSPRGTKAAGLSTSGLNLAAALAELAARQANRQD